MKKTILIAPNSFKESLDSIELADLFRDNLSEKGFNLITVPLSDGGDGFLNVCRYHFNLEELTFHVSSPYSSQLEVKAGYDKISQTVYIESADVVGLKIIPPGKRNPMLLSSRGLGELLLKLADSYNVKKIVIGVGGTGVNDLGLGILSAMGLRLLDRNKEIINPVPANFSEIEDFIWKPEFNSPLELVVDVDNPLTGKNGTTFIYGPQKGLGIEQVPVLDSAFKRITEMFYREGIISRDFLLSGAGGGIAAGMQIFLGAELKTSSTFILQDLKLKSLIDKADYIITGEGSFDSQSRSGKGTYVIINNSKNTIFLVCGEIKNKSGLPPHVQSIELKKYFKSAFESMKRTPEGIAKASDEIIKQISS